MILLILVNAAVFCAIAAFVCVFVAATKEAKPERTISEIKAGHKPPWTLTDERADAAAFMADPTLFWLDPNRYGDDPNWLTRLFPLTHHLQGLIAPTKEEEWEAQYRIIPSHPCPSCGGVKSAITAEHGNEPSMWNCPTCQIEYTKAGETKSSKRERKLRNSTDIADRYLAKPKKLPCGCPFEVENKQDHEGYRYSKCRNCGAEWVPRSNDPSGRTLAQGERVYVSGMPVVEDKITRLLAKEKAWERMIASGGNDGAGSCPDHTGCGWPVVKLKNVEYRCTRVGCRHHEKGWR